MRREYIALVNRINEAMMFRLTVKVEPGSIIVYKRRGGVGKYKIHTAHRMIKHRVIYGSEKELEKFIEGMAAALDCKEDMVNIYRSEAVSITSKIAKLKRSTDNSKLIILDLINVLLKRYRYIDVIKMLEGIFGNESNVKRLIGQARALEVLYSVGLEAKTIRKYGMIGWYKISRFITKENRNDVLRSIKKHGISKIKKIREDL